MASLAKQNSQLADRNDKPLIGARQAAITAAATTGVYADDDDALVAAINAIITALEAHGLIESND